MIALSNKTEKKTVSCLPVKQLTKKMLSRAMLLVAYFFYDVFSVSISCFAFSPFC
jgi:hypothetical protein